MTSTSVATLLKRCAQIDQIQRYSANLSKQQIRSRRIDVRQQSRAEIVRQKARARLLPTELSQVLAQLELETVSGELETVSRELEALSRDLLRLRPLWRANFFCYF